MKILLLCLLVINSHLGYASYLSAYGGFHLSQHQYLPDSANLSTPYVGMRFDSTEFRRRPTGWLARGVGAQISQGQSYQQLRGQVPVFHWTKLQGLWFDYEYIKQTLESDLIESAIFLGQDGTTTAIPANSNVSSDHQISRMALYWYESSKQVGPINYLGLYQSTEITPATSTLTGTNATLFDSEFRGYGLILGRKKDTRGLNFQWTLRLAQLDSNFSNDVTGHRALSEKESTVYQLDMDMAWHYRLYLAPYWYLVPELRIRFSAMTQTTMEPLQVEHDAFTLFESQTAIHLQKRF